MAKFQTTPSPPLPAPPPGLVWYKLPSGIYILRQKTTNLNSNSSNYQTMNNRVLWLDNQFKALPLTGPDLTACQQAWDNWSSNFSGITVCGCARDTINGQKIFRLTNFMAQFFSQGPFLAPDASWTLTAKQFTSYVITPPNPPALGRVDLYAPAGGNESQNLFQFGLGLNNPILAMPSGATNYPIVEGTADYDLFANPPGGSPVTICVFTNDFQPVAVQSLPVT